MPTALNKAALLGRYHARMIKSSFLKKYCDIFTDETEQNQQCTDMLIGGARGASRKPVGGSPKKRAATQGRPLVFIQ